MLPITYEEAAALLKALAAERPSYVYTLPEEYRREGGAPANCVYLDSFGNPSCLVGHVLVELGVDSSELAARKDVPAHVLPESWFAGTRTAWLLRRAQMAQDEGEPWGVAVQIALAASQPAG